jgi:hypothetical protein
MKLLLSVLFVPLNHVSSFPSQLHQQASRSYENQASHTALRSHALLSNEDSLVSFTISNGRHEPIKTPSIPTNEQKPSQFSSSLAYSEQPHNENFPVKAVKIYTDYASKLWKETNFSARRRITKDKASAAVKGVKQAIQSGGFSQTSNKAREQLMEACQTVLAEMEDSSSSGPTASENAIVETSQRAGVIKKRSRSKLFGAMMGVLAACWVFSGNYVFTGLFNLVTIISQLEFHRAVVKTGVYPARRIAILGACSMFLSVRTNAIANSATGWLVFLTLK